MQHRSAVGLLLLTALCWSTGGVLIKWISWPPLAVAGGRGLVAVAFMVLLYRRFKFTWSPVQIGAAVAYAACTLTFVAATKLTTAANAILLQYTAPVWVALLGTWLLGERATRADWLAIAAVFVGMLLFFADSVQLSGSLGNFIAILSAVSFACMAILVRKQKDGSAVESIVLGNLIAGLVGLPFILQAPALDTEGWVALMALGIVQLGVPYALYVIAIKHVTALEAVLIPVLEAILNPVWVLLLIGERPGPLSMAGGLIVLAAVIWRAAHSIRSSPLSPHAGRGLG